MSRRKRHQLAQQTEVQRARRALIYTRVSTEEQAQNAHSLIEQEHLLIEWCARENYEVVGRHVDAGFSARSLKRPAFQQMVDRAFDATANIDAVVVHSLSRGFRNLIEQEGVIAHLRATGIRFVAVRDNIPDGAAGLPLRVILGLTNQMKSEESSLDTMRGMDANARAGYNNGGQIALGYRSVEAGTVGQKIKKRLAIDPVEAELVRLIFSLAESGDGSHGPMGTAKIARYINEHGHRTRQGNAFGTGSVYEILTRETYTGEREWNPRSPDGRWKEESEIITVEVPGIIEQTQFDRVQELLTSRHPKLKGPRLTSAPSLLGGLIRCETCGGAMSPTSGTSRTGDTYTYYCCSNRIKKGGFECAGMRISRPTAETAVMQALVDRLITPGRIEAMLQALHAGRAQRNASVHARVSALHLEFDRAEAALKAFYAGIATGGINPLEPTFAAILNATVQKRDVASTALERALALVADEVTINPSVVATFAERLRDALQGGETAARKMWLSSIVDRIIVGHKTIRIVGRSDNFERGLKNHEKGSPPVRSSVQEWCPWPESNQHSLQNPILSRTRLPIPPQGLTRR
jgi:site-specific DNA recombinase